MTSVFACKLAWSAGMPAQLKGVEQRIEQVHAAAVHLDSQLHLVACINAGFTIGTAVVLPMLQVSSA